MTEGTVAVMEQVTDAPLLEDAAVHGQASGDIAVKLYGQVIIARNRCLLQQIPPPIPSHRLGAER